MKKKLIIRNEPVEMTIEEVLKRYDNLITQYARKFANYGREFEDMHQLASIAVWMAYRNYDYSKGFSLSTLVFITLNNIFKGAIRTDMAMKRIPYNQTQSADVVIEGKDRNTTPLIDLIALEENFDNEVTTKIDIDRYTNELSVRDKEIFTLLVEGYTQKEISRLIGLSQVQISRIITEIRSNLNELHLKRA